MIYNRDFYVKKLIKKQKNGYIKIITGLRRVGKSFLLFNIFYDYLLKNGYDKNHIVTINFDDKDHMVYRNSDAAYNLIKGKIKDEKDYVVLLDEVQLINDFVPILNSLLHMKNVDCFVTGSNSKFLTKDVVTEFRGRGDELHLHPLSFSELYKCEGDRFKIFNDYIMYGGLPAVNIEDDTRTKSELLKNIFNETYLLDIIERYNIRKNEELDILLNVLSSQVGSFTSITKIINTFNSKYNDKISTNTIKAFIEILKDTFLIREVARYDIKGRKYIGAESKYYFEDIGLRNARIGFRQNEPSHALENIIYNELLRRGYDIDVGIIDKKDKNNDYKTNKRYEVDFVAQSGHKKYYVQSTLEMGTASKREQEYNSLKLIDDSFKKFIIRYDNAGTYVDDLGIINMGIFDFLLNDNCFEYE